MMRLSPLVPAALILCMSGPAAAQPPSPQAPASLAEAERGGGPPSPQAPASLAEAERGGGDWIDYTSREDFFMVNFPGAPTVKDITYPTEYGTTVPGRVYSVEDRSSRYSVTVVDYSPAEKFHAERSRNCKGYPDTCGNRWPNELRGALDYAVSTFIQRDARVTYYAWADTDRIEGRRVQLTNADRSRTFVAVYMHENRLYVLDGTVPAGMPPPALFQQSLGLFDKNGVRVRYETIYRNGYPPPPRVKTQGRLQGC